MSKVNNFQQPYDIDDRKKLYKATEELQSNTNNKILKSMKLVLKTFYWTQDYDRGGLLSAHYSIGKSNTGNRHRYFYRGNEAKTKCTCSDKQ